MFATSAARRSESHNWRIDATMRHSRRCWVNGVPTRRVDPGRVVDFTTYMMGELYGVLLSHSILGRMSARTAVGTAGAAFLRGVDRGLLSDDITHAIFGARTQVLAGEMAATDVDDWLS